MLCAKRVRHAEVCLRARWHLAHILIGPDRVWQFYEQFASAVLGPERAPQDEQPSAAEPPHETEFFEKADRTARAAQRVLELGGLDPVWFKAAVQTVIHNE